MIGIKSTIFCIALASVLCVVQVRAGFVGGLAGEREADETVRNVIKNVEGHIREQYPGKMQSISPISYRTQLVSGMNYFIKAIITEHGGKKSPVHLRIWKKVSGDHELTKIKTDVDETTELHYFQ